MVKNTVELMFMTKQDFIVKYLKLFDFEESATTSDNEVVVDEAAQAVIAAISSGLFALHKFHFLTFCLVIKLMFCFVVLQTDQFNTENVMELIRSSIVCNVMSATPKYKELYELLTIVYEGNVNDFEIFYKSNTESFQSLGLSYENLQNKMRLLTLCSLGNVVGGDHSYSFRELMDSLQLKSQNELEELVICAISKKLLFAKIDYELSQVDITRAKQRTFDKNAWHEVAEKLSRWRQNTNTVLQIIHNAGLTKWRQQYMAKIAKMTGKK